MTRSRQQRGIQGLHRGQDRETGGEERKETGFERKQRVLTAKPLSLSHTKSQKALQAVAESHQKWSYGMSDFPARPTPCPSASSSSGLQQTPPAGPPRCLQPQSRPEPPDPHRHLEKRQQDPAVHLHYSPCPSRRRSGGPRPQCRTVPTSPRAFSHTWNHTGPSQSPPSPPSQPQRGRQLLQDPLFPPPPHRLQHRGCNRILSTPPASPSPPKCGVTGSFPPPKTPRRPAAAAPLIPARRGGR